MLNMPRWGDFRKQGWLRFGFDPEIASWASHAHRSAQSAVVDPANAHWHQCQNTWFVGVDALNNDMAGRINGSDALTGQVFDFIQTHMGKHPFHKAQISVIKPGYPRPREGESASNFNYRQRRDAAHVDGLKAEGPDRRRRICEPHSYIVGLPLTKASADAAPLVVWQGSHHIIRQAFTKALADHDPATWSQIDITDAYISARRCVFETCERIQLPAQPGEATLIHRLTLHGVAPWGEMATSDPDGRVIAYFRPQLDSVSDWLSAP